MGLNDDEQYSICKKVHNDKLTIQQMKKLILVAKQKRFVRHCLFVYLAALWNLKVKDKKGEVEVCNLLFHNFVDKQFESGGCHYEN